VEQNLSLVRRLTDRVVVLGQGRVVHAGALPAEPDRIRTLLGVGA
jgi:ABC-type branched-subunit amino acid transport system ATPase component